MAPICLWGMWLFALFCRVANGGQNSRRGGWTSVELRFDGYFDGILESTSAKWGAIDGTLANSNDVRAFTHAGNGLDDVTTGVL